MTTYTHRLCYRSVTCYVPLDHVLKDIQEAKASAQLEGWIDLELQIMEDYGGSTALTVTGKRPETEQETRSRMKAEEQAKKYRREQYKQLKKEFEKE